MFVNYENPPLILLISTQRLIFSEIEKLHGYLRNTCLNMKIDTCRYITVSLFSSLPFCFLFCFIFFYFSKFKMWVP